MREAFEFEILVKDIFRHQGIEIDDENRMYRTDRGVAELDFLAVLKDKRYVEVKFYRQSSQNTSLLKKATKQLLGLMAVANVPNGILVVSSHVRPEHVEEIEKLGVLVISRSDIFNMASGSIELSEKLSSLLEDDRESSLEDDRESPSKENILEKIQSSEPIDRLEEIVGFFQANHVCALN